MKSFCENHPSPTTQPLPHGPSHLDVNTTPSPSPIPPPTKSQLSHDPQTTLLFSPLQWQCKINFAILLPGLSPADSWCASAYHSFFEGGRVWVQTQNSIWKGNKGGNTPTPQGGGASTSEGSDGCIPAQASAVGKPSNGWGFSPFTFSNKFQVGGVLNPAILWFLICRLLVNNSLSLLLLTTAWLNDNKATGLPVGALPTHQHQPSASPKVHLQQPISQGGNLDNFTHVLLE